MTTTFKDQGAQRPTALGSLLQASAYGATIPTIYGQTQSNFLAIWAANLRQGAPGQKKFQQLKKGTTNYEECIDFLIGHNPIRGVLQIVNNGSNTPLNFTSQTFSQSGGRGAFEVTDPNFYFVIAVTVKASYSFDIDDYGGQGPQTLTGTFEIPLWNELETGPDPTDPMSYRCWPYCYRWQSGMGATVAIDAEAFPSGDVKVYYAQLTAATSYLPPLAKLYMAFEPQLGSGDEYENGLNPDQQIIYPQFAGAQSSEIDLGSSGTLPQLNPEIAGKWGVYSTGDADFVDIIEDIYKSGLAQAAIAADTADAPTPATTQMERGLSSYDLPGTIQKKVDGSATSAIPPMKFDMANAAGNMLIAIATATAAGSGGISGPKSLPIPGGATWNPTYWEIASISPNQLRTPAGALGYFGAVPATYFTAGTAGSIPSGAIIDGVIASLGYISQGATASYLSSVQLCHLGAGIGTAKTINLQFQPYDQTMTEGGSTDVWGASLTPAIVNDPSFGFLFQMQATGGRRFVQAAFLTVYYHFAAFTLNSANGETWTKQYSDGLGYQVWTAPAVGGPNSVSLVGAVAPWQIGIIEVGGLGNSATAPEPVTSPVFVAPTTASSSGAIEGICFGSPYSGSASAFTGSGGGTGTVQLTGGCPLFTPSVESTWGGFAAPNLPSGAVVTSIMPTLIGTGSFVAFGDWKITQNYTNGSASPTSTYPTTPTGTPADLATACPSVGASLPTLPSVTLMLSDQNTLNGAASDEINVLQLGLLVHFTAPPPPPLPPLWGNILDAIVTASAPSASVTSTVAASLPGYLLAISIYPGGSAPPAVDGPTWDAATPANIFGNSPGTFQIQERIIYAPGTYSNPPNGGSPSSVCLIALKAVVPVSYPRPLGDFIDVPSFNLVRSQCRANGLWGSLTMNSQSTAEDWVKALVQAADCAPVFLGEKLFLYPYSEVSTAGNGAEYTAPTAQGPTALLNADNGDFVGSGGCPILETVDRIGLPNVLQMQCIDRNALYNQVSVQTPDPATLGLYGIRKASPTTNNAIQDPSIARKLLTIQMRRNDYLGDKWTFQLSARWSLLSPMDLVTLTDTLQGVIGVAVRITSYEEQSDGSFQGQAELFAYGTSAPNSVSVTSPDPNPPPVAATAGDVNPPVIFEPVPALYPSQTGERIWLVVSSSADNFGGAQVFISTDGGASYNPAPGGADANSNIVIGSAVTGELTGDWPAANSPDTTNNLAVDLTESLGVLQTLSVSAENNLELPCYVADTTEAIALDVAGSPVASGATLGLNVSGTAVATLGTLQVAGTAVASSGLPSSDFGYELMAYAVATLTAANKYSLKATGAGNFLLRSIMGAPSLSGVGVDHPTGSRFAALNQSGAGILKMALPPQYIGQVLWFKVCSFNTFGAALQSLADVPAYSYTPTGIPGAV